MSRKKKGDTPMPPAAPEPPSPSRDRHKPRLSIHLRPRVHHLIAALATKNFRPLRMEVELAVLDHLRKAGVDIPPEVLEYD